MTKNNYFITPDDVESQLFDWGVLKWMSTPDVTSGERFSAGVVRVKPGKGHERHTHPDSDEILYIIRGEGEQEVADKTRDIKAGDTVYIPEGTEHGTLNTGWEPLIFLAVYAPPGPEDVLRNLPECSIVPPGEFSNERTSKQRNENRQETPIDEEGK